MLYTSVATKPQLDSYGKAWHSSFLTLAKPRADSPVTVIDSEGQVLPVHVLNEVWDANHSLGSLVGQITPGVGE